MDKNLGEHGTSQLLEQFFECINLVESESYSDTNITKAKKLFKQCLDVDLNYIEKLFDEIFKVLQQKKFVSVFAFFQVALVIGEVLVEDDSKAIYRDGCMRDIKFFLYLINYISREVPMPDSLKFVFDGIDYNSIRLDENDPRYRSICGLNEYRKKEMLGEYCSSKVIPLSNIWCKITSFLSSQVQKKTSNFKRRIMKKLNDEDYSGLLDTLLHEKGIRVLSVAWEKTLILLQIILNCTNTSVQDILINFDGDKFDDVEYKEIVRGEFKKARDLRCERKKFEDGVSKDIIIKLLDKLIGLQDEKCNLSTNCGCSNNFDVTFDDIAFGLIGGFGVEHVLEILPRYLASINKVKYEFFIAGLIRICVLEGDITFIAPLRFLAQIRDGSFRVDVGDIENKIYEVVAYNERVIAFSYLDILKEFNNIGISVESSLISSLKSFIENWTSNKKNEDIFDANGNSSSHYYGISDFAGLKKKIEDTNLGIEEACRELGIFDSETINLIRLIFARDCYCFGMFEAGDKLVVAVEKSKNKTDRLKFVLNDVRGRKKFYMYQEEMRSSIKVLKLVKP